MKSRASFALAGLLGLSVAFGRAQQIVDAFPHLTFQQPIFLCSSPDSTNRIFVVQQTGEILAFPNDTAATSATTFLDLSDSISSFSGEEGLLGLAFDPGFSTNGFFYVNYTAPNPLHTVVERFRTAQGTHDVADPASGYHILEFNQPFNNHNGGMLAFGADGYLYIGTGDGGSGGDPYGNAQNRSVVLGKILRIDVSDTSATMHYRIPPDNPFAGNTSGYREEIWAFGFRNPWRFSFDPPTGRLWVGDVGQDSREEVDIVEGGKNYGWNIMEGTLCYNPPSGCDTAGLTMPIIDYSHALGNAITGGYIYRGWRRPDLAGMYLYGDYGSGRIWALRYLGGQVALDSLLMQIPTNISSFGVDDRNELYIVTHSYSARTSIYCFASSPVSWISGDGGRHLPLSFALDNAYPNPFNPTTVVSYQLPVASHVELSVYDLLGRRVRTLVNEAKTPGTYTVRFDATNLASGAYYCRMVASKETGAPFSAVSEIVIIR